MEHWSYQEIMALFHRLRSRLANPFVHLSHNTSGGVGAKGGSLFENCIIKERLCWKRVKSGVLFSNFKKNCIWKNANVQSRKITLMKILKRTKLALILITTKFLTSIQPRSILIAKCLTLILRTKCQTLIQPRS